MNVASRKQEVFIPFTKHILDPIWNMQCRCDTTARHGNWGIIMEIEDCQRQFTKIIEGMSLLPYRQRLQLQRLR